MIWNRTLSYLHKYIRRLKRLSSEKDSVIFSPYSPWTEHVLGSIMFISFFVLILDCFLAILDSERLILGVVRRPSELILVFSFVFVSLEVANGKSRKTRYIGILMRNEMMPRFENIINASICSRLTMSMEKLMMMHRLLTTKFIASRITAVLRLTPL